MSIPAPNHQPDSAKPEDKPKPTEPQFDIHAYMLAKLLDESGMGAGPCMAAGRQPGRFPRLAELELMGCQPMNTMPVEP